jgi:hypothetical protein
MEATVLDATDKVLHYSRIDNDLCKIGSFFDHIDASLDR